MIIFRFFLHLRTILEEFKEHRVIFCKVFKIIEVEPLIATNCCYLDVYLVDILGEIYVRNSQNLLDAHRGFFNLGEE